MADGAAPNPDMMTGDVPNIGTYQPPNVSVLSGQIPGQMPMQHPDYDPAIQAAAVHHGRLADALNSVSKILGGGQNLRINRNADGSVDVQPVDTTPGQRWGRIAATALSGAAKGFSVGQGPGGMGRAAGAGVDTGLQAAQMQQAQQDKTLALADKMNDQNRQKQLFNANMAKMNQDLIQSQWRMQNEKMKSVEDENDRQAQIATTMRNMNATKVHIPAGVNPDEYMDNVSNRYNTDKGLQQAHQEGRVAVFSTFDPKTKEATGSDIYTIPEDQNKKMYPGRYERYTLDWDGTKNAPTKKPMGTIEANSMPNEQVWAMMQADQKQHSDTTTAFAKYEGDIALQKLQLEQTRAQAAQARAAEKAGKYTTAIGSDNRLYIVNEETQEARPVNVTGAAPGTTVTTPALYGKQQTANAAAQQSAQGKISALNFANNYVSGIATGRQQATGAMDEALMEQYFEIAKPEKGFRMTETQTSMLGNARPWLEAGKAAVAHGLQGSYYTDKQRQQIAGAMYELARAKGIHIGANGQPVLLNPPSGGEAPPSGAPPAQQLKVAVPGQPGQPAQPAQPQAGGGGQGGDVWSRSKVVQPAGQ